MSCDYLALPHAGIQTLKPYIPGKSTEELARELGISDIIKLASNENQLGCSPLAKKAIADMSNMELATYPSPINHRLIKLLSKHLNVDASMITVGNGSDTLYTQLLTLFALRNGKHILTHEYAFSTYAIQAKTLGIPVVVSGVGDQFSVDIDAMIQAVNPETALIFLANPNNPTGLLIPLEEIERLLTAIPDSTILVLDEAYFEYAFPLDDQRSIAFLKRYRNLVITRTFSKIYGLAGIRLGYAIANPDIIALINRIQLPFVVNRVALEAASAALSDIDFINQTLRMNQQGLKQVKQGLTALGYTMLPSHCNFITFDCRTNGLEIFHALLKKGIIVRPLTPYGMDNYLRVSIGTPQQNSRFLQALEEINL